MSPLEIARGLAELNAELIKIVRSQAMNLAALGYPSIGRAQIDGFEASLENVRQTLRQLDEAYDRVSEES